MFNSFFVKDMKYNISNEIGDKKYLVYKCISEHFDTIITLPGDRFALKKGNEYLRFDDNKQKIENVSYITYGGCFNIKILKCSEDENSISVKITSGNMLTEIFFNYDVKDYNNKNYDSTTPCNYEIKNISELFGNITVENRFNYKFPRASQIFNEIATEKQYNETQHNHLVNTVVAAVECERLIKLYEDGLCCRPQQDTQNYRNHLCRYISGYDRFSHSGPDSFLTEFCTEGIFMELARKNNFNLTTVRDDLLSIFEEKRTNWVNEVYFRCGLVSDGTYRIVLEKLNIDIKLVPSHSTDPLQDVFLQKRHKDLFNGYPNNFMLTYQKEEIEYKRKIKELKERKERERKEQIKFDEDLEIARRKYRQDNMVKQMKEQDIRIEQTDKVSELIKKIEDSKRDKKIEELEKKIRELEHAVKNLKT